VIVVHAQVSQKRKEHLQKRKEKKKEVKAEKLIKNLRGDDSDEDANQKVEQKLKLEEKMYVRFGEQAERPPMIKLNKPLKGLQKQVAHDSK
jgi:hypothetical protein